MQSSGFDEFMNGSEFEEMHRRRNPYYNDSAPVPESQYNNPNNFQENHPYAEENRHQLVAMQMSRMWVSRTVWAHNIAFTVNCISRYAAQKGKCAITKRFLIMDEGEGHHIKPRYKGGTDEYENIIVLSPEVHWLVKATNPVLIKDRLEELKLNKKQLAKLNELRFIYGTAAIA